MKGAQSLDQWAHEQLEGSRSESRRERLKKLLADLHKHPDSMSLPVGSAQRLMVERHERNVLQKAMGMGYQPPKEQIKEMGLHLGLELGLGL